MSAHLKIKKNDLVLVIAGNDRGKRGKVLKVYPGQAARRRRGRELHQEAPEAHARPVRRAASSRAKAPFMFPTSC